jgi:hypothetical protein
MAFTQTLANIQVDPCEVEWASTGVGYLEGDISVTVEEQVVDITAHSEGTNVLDSIRTGKSCEVTMTLKESASGQFDTIVSSAGGATDSAGSSGVDVIGWGSGKDFTGVSAQAGKLVLHPVTNAASDYSEDLAFWKAYPMLDSITISGENPRTMSVTFKCYPDLDLSASEIRLWIRGDHTQTWS